MKRQSKYIITNKINGTSLQYVSPINDCDDESEEMEEGESEEAAAAAFEREGTAVTESERDIEGMEIVPETEEMEIVEQDDVLAEESMGGRRE